MAENKLIELKHHLGVAYENIKKEKNWFLFRHIWFRPNVMTSEDTIRLIKENNLSASRFGDGEFRLMVQQGDIGFQDKNEDLSKALLDAFHIRNEKLLICSYNFKNDWTLDNYAGQWLKGFVNRYYKYVKELFDKSYCYGDTDITRFYQPAFYKKTKFDYLDKTYIPMLRSIWTARNLLIVEGNQTKLGMGNDLFQNAKSIRRIVGPARNAFDKIDELYNLVEGYYQPGDLVLLALGPTASVLSARLAVEKGYQCIDIGHIDVVYMWFLNRVPEASSIEGKYVNEARKGANAISCSYDEEEYQHQIVARTKDLV